MENTELKNTILKTENKKLMSLTIGQNTTKKESMTQKIGKKKILTLTHQKTQMGKYRKQCEKIMTHGSKLHVTGVPERQERKISRHTQLKTF